MPSACPAAGEVHRGDAREPRGDDPPGARDPGAARRRRADPQLRRGRLRAGLCLRPRRLCAGRLRRAAPDGQGHGQRVRRLPGRDPGQARRQGAQQARTLGQADPRAFRRSTSRYAGTPPPADARRAGARAAILGRAGHRGAHPRRSCPSSTSAACINSSGASGSKAARWTISSAGRSRSCGR